MVVHETPKLKIVERRIGPVYWAMRKTPRRVAVFLAMLDAAGLDLQSPLRGAEVGVWRGGFSRWVLSNCPRLHLRMVDRWSPAKPGDPDWEVDEPGARSKPEDRRWHKHVAVRNTAFAANRRKIVEADSVEGAHGVADGSLDFVFIDASHLYQAVLEDLRAWAPKVRPGGAVTGDDIDHPASTPAAKYWDVRGALATFAEETGSIDLWIGSDFIWGYRKGG